MAIISSTYEFSGPAQPDGSRDVIESHTDSVGGVHKVNYRAPSGADYQAIANARAASVAAQLADKEFLELVNG